MTLSEMKIKILALIEELNPEHPLLTKDADLQKKLEPVIVQVSHELARMKKIPDYVELSVREGDLIRLEDIEAESGRAVYQIGRCSGVSHEWKASGAVIRILADGVLEVSYFCYPKPITDKNREKYVFDLSPDALELLPYGVAADLLRSDPSAQYGSVYATRYEQLLSRLDPRYRIPTVTIEGGVDFG